MLKINLSKNTITFLLFIVTICNVLCVCNSCKDNSKNKGNYIFLNFEEPCITIGKCFSKLTELEGRSKPNNIVNEGYRMITTFFNINEEIFKRITANSKIVFLKRKDKTYKKYIIFAVRTNNDKFYLGLCKNYNDTFSKNGNGLFEGNSLKNLRVLLIPLASSWKPTKANTCTGISIASKYLAITGTEPDPVPPSTEDTKIIS